jgi:hypothetical protein
MLIPARHALTMLSVTPGCLMPSIIEKLVAAGWRAWSARKKSSMAE